MPCEEDGVVVVLGVVRVVALLRVGPSAHLLQAARWVATLDQAYRLHSKNEKKKKKQQTVNGNVIISPYQPPPQVSHLLQVEKDSLTFHLCVM